jgi:hypothetical protein
LQQFFICRVSVAGAIEEKEFHDTQSLHHPRLNVHPKRDAVEIEVMELAHHSGNMCMRRRFRSSRSNAGAGRPADISRVPVGSRAAVDSGGTMDEDEAFFDIFTFEEPSE